jgi:hypothetical protein
MRAYEAARSEFESSPGKRVLLKGWKQGFSAGFASDGGAVFQAEPNVTLITRALIKSFDNESLMIDNRGVRIIAADDGAANFDFFMDPLTQILVDGVPLDQVVLPAKFERLRGNGDSLRLSLEHGTLTSENGRLTIQLDPKPSDPIGPDDA